MQRAMTLLAFALVTAVMGCAKSSGEGPSGLVGLSQARRSARWPRTTSVPIDAGPVVTPTREIACRQVDGPQPHIIRAWREKKLVVFRATCPATVGCLSRRSRSSSARAGRSPAR